MDTTEVTIPSQKQNSLIPKLLDSGLHTLILIWYDIQGAKKA
jgi:hypothetical protein